MNFFRQHRAMFATSLLVAVLVVVPHLAFAAEDISAVDLFFQKTLWYLLIPVTSLFLYLGGIIFDFAINYFVIGFANLYLTTGVGVAVDKVWVILRDFMNMLFIFGLLYIGFKMILDSNDSNTRRWLVNLVIAAVLINFSLLATKLVVDFSNQLAAQIAISGLRDTSKPLQTTAVGTPEIELATYIYQLTSIADLYNCKDKYNADGCGGGYGYIFGTSIFFIITGFVLGAGGILLMIRFVALIFFMLCSPFMFISWILPPVRDIMTSYWKKFLGRAFFAPLYFLFIYFSLEMLLGLQQSIGLSSRGSKWANALSSKDGATVVDATQSTIPFFFMICAFMIGSLLIAQKLGAEGADKAVDIGKSLRNKAASYTKKGAGMATVGAAGYVGRNTIGKRMYNYAQTDAAKDKASRSYLGKLQYQAAKKLGDSSFDARRVGGVGKSLGIGEGQKGGYAKQLKDAKEKEKKFYGKDGLGFVDTDSVEGRIKVDEQKIAVKTRIEKEKEAKEKEISKQERIKELAEYDTEALKKYAENKKTERETKEQEIASFETQMANMPPEQKERAKKRFEILQKELEPFLQREVEAQEAAKVAAQKDAIKKELEQLQITAWEANQRGDSTAYENAKKNQAVKQSQLDKITKDLDKGIAVLQTEVSDLETTLGDKKQIEKIATAEVKFSRQIEYMKQVERSQKVWANPFTLGSGSVGSAAVTAGAASALGAAATLGAGGLYGVTAGVAIKDRADTLKAVAKDIDKEYGKGGAKTIGKQKRQERRQENQEADKDEYGDDKKDKKDDDKDD